MARLGETVPAIAAHLGIAFDESRLTLSGRDKEMAKARLLEAFADLSDDILSALTGGKTSTRAPEPAEEPDSEDYESMLKDTLLGVAQAKGLDVTASNTKAEIIAAIEDTQIND